MLDLLHTIANVLLASPRFGEAWIVLEHIRT